VTPASSASGSVRSEALTQHTRCEEGDDEDGRGSGDERDEGEHEPQPGRVGDPFAHPLALSTSWTTSGCPPGGLMSNVTPQWPTITSAGVERSYTPGEVSANL